jgi:hypothetical protein
MQQLFFMSVKNKSTRVRKKLSTPSKRTGSAGPRFILLGGFLGAGKTACLKKLVEWVEAQQLKVGVVTNDQADRLVDTAVALDGAAADSVRQISGGCFCCKADDLVAKLHELQLAGAAECFDRRAGGELHGPDGDGDPIAATGLPGGLSDGSNLIFGKLPGKLCFGQLEGNKQSRE